jgi:hypothetical protein
MAQLPRRGCEHVAEIGSVQATEQDEMTKTLAVLALLVTAMVVGASFLGVPGPSVLQAQEDPRAEAADAGPNCHLVEVALDEGYGVTRRVARRDCSAVQ